MAEKFRGLVNLDIRESVPDWSPYEQPKAPPGTPNVLYIVLGRDGGEPVTDDYPGEEPWSFTRGTLRRIAVDVSGAPYLDLEREAAAMVARE